MSKRFQIFFSLNFITFRAEYGPYFMYIPLLPEQSALISTGLLIQDLEFGTFLKKAPQGQNLGLWY